MSPEDRALCVVAAALLRRGRMLHHVSAGLALLAILAMSALALLGPPHARLAIAGLCVILVAGLFETVLSARIAVDADLFAALAAGNLDLDGLDAALSRLGLMGGAKLGRPLDARLKGAFRLMKQQAACLAVQLAIMLALGGLAALSAPFEWLPRG